jgi:hypothetical protein
MVLRGGPRGRVGRRRTCLKRAAPDEVERPSSFVWVLLGADAGGWFAWLRDAERRGDEERAAPVRAALGRVAVAQTVGTRRPRGRTRALRRARGPRKGTRGLPVPAGQRVAFGESRPPGVLATPRGRAAPMRRAKARAGRAPSLRGKTRAPLARVGTARVGTARARPGRVRTARARTARAGTAGAGITAAGTARAATPGAQAGQAPHAGVRRPMPRTAQAGAHRPQGTHETRPGPGRGEARGRQPLAERAGRPGPPHQAKRADVRPTGVVTGNAGPGLRPGLRSAGLRGPGRATVGVTPAGGRVRPAQVVVPGPRIRRAPGGRADRAFLTRSPPSSLTPRRVPS